MAKILKDSHNRPNDETVDLQEIGSDSSAGRPIPKRPVWEIIVALGEQISDEEWAKAPDDASINYKHYLYGAPKKQV